jgi:hypothetical protein
VKTKHCHANHYQLTQHKQPKHQRYHSHPIERTCLSKTIASLDETQIVGLSFDYFSDDEIIDAEGASALADALQGNTSVTTINLDYNNIGAEGALALANVLKVNTFVTNISLKSNGIGIKGALALADSLKLNTSVTNINLTNNVIDDEGASTLADALKVNTSVTSINLDYNALGDEGASALADALKVNTSVISIDLRGIRSDKSHHTLVDELIACNKRLRHLFIFDARKMLLSLMCADECGVAWPYLLDGDDLSVIVAPDEVASLRAEFAVVVEERRRRAAVVVQRQVAADVDGAAEPAVQRRRTKR